MRIRSRAFWLPKAGCSIEEYEDAFWPAPPFDRDIELFRAAVADGATEASFAGVWARILVRAYCKGQVGGKKLIKFLPVLQKEWTETVGDRPLPWYAEQKAAQGGFSTITGLTLFDDGRWESSSIGDSCLFQVRDDRIVVSFPLDHSSQFGSRPVLLSSRGSGAESLVSYAGEWNEGDVFYLMTDAIAAWFLRCVEAELKVPSIFLELDEDTLFAERIVEWRRDGAIKNDDVTVLRIRLGG
jgi:hypothetical protein